MNTLNFLFALVSISFCVCLPARVATLSNETDFLALLALKKGFYGDGDTGSSNVNGPLSSWNSSVHFCYWTGIRCGRLHQRVIALDLSGISFAGTLSPYIGNLTFLRSLNLSDCNLQGVVPGEIGSLYRLRNFTLKNNLLRGGFPLHLTNCSELRIVDLSKNGLTGMIPSEIGLLSKLQILLMLQNNLTGEITRDIVNISSLVKLDLGDNKFVGSIPSGLGKLKSLTKLTLGINHLSGPVPLSLYNLSWLTAISLVQNRLSGNILEKMGFFSPHLEWVALGNNYFTGVIPPTLANISSLRSFDVGMNHIHGNIPKGLGMLNNLQWFLVDGNNIGSGESGDLDFLSSFANLSKLSFLGLDNNHFGAVLPHSIGNLSGSLQHLSLGNNWIHGSIPHQIGNLIGLVGLGFEYNRLIGEIPAPIGNIYKLNMLTIGGNNLSGNIPSSFGNLTSLYIVGLHGNNLEGSLPQSLNRCIGLHTLNVENNRLNGDLSLKIVSSLHQINVLIMPGNLFTGNIPKELGNLIYLRILDISENKYAGKIPIEIGKCLMLETLMMGGNMFTGHIPLTLISLKGLQVVDLSRNYLSGSIPLQTQDLSKLEIFNVAFNHLEGYVPERGVFSNLSAISLQGNNELCGGISALMLPPCPHTNGKHISVTIIIAATLSGTLFLVFLVVLVVWSRKRASIVKLTSYSSMNEGYMRLSYTDLLEATNQFASSNLIGVGSFGSVYRGILLKEGEKLIAVKVMNLMKHGALKSFWTECKALSKIRHKNLLRIISCCSSLDFKGNDFMALVYELMPNGSLDSWLHEARNLKLEQRLDIAIDIALALDYLHHHSVPQIAHCDLKPSNVLLDEDLVAHVGDFGLAKLLQVSGDTEASKDGSSSLAIKGTVGYIPPEYGMGGNVSTQGDMYSYGILLLEMITGKRPTDEMFKGSLNLHQTVKAALSNFTIADILDSHLTTEFFTDIDISIMPDDVFQQLLECIAAIAEIGIACSVESPDERMDAGDALKVLHSIKRKFPAVVSSQQSSVHS